MRMKIYPACSLDSKPESSQSKALNRCHARTRTDDGGRSLQKQGICTLFTA